MSLPCTGASGAFGSLDEIGKAATLFRDPVASEVDVVRQVRAGTIWCVALGITPGAAEPVRDRGERHGGERRGPDRHGPREGRGRGDGGRPRGGGRGRGGSGRR
jgi:hypothetical protein